MCTATCVLQNFHYTHTQTHTHVCCRSKSFVVAVSICGACIGCHGLCGVQICPFQRDIVVFDSTCFKCFRACSYACPCARMFACVCVVPLAAVVFASTHMCVADTRNPWSLFVLGWCHAHTHLCCRTKLHRYSRKSVMTCRLVVLVCDRLHAHVYVEARSPWSRLRLWCLLA